MECPQRMSKLQNWFLLTLKGASSNLDFNKIELPGNPSWPHSLDKMFPDHKNQIYVNCGGVLSEISRSFGVVFVVV